MTVKELARLLRRFPNPDMEVVCEAFDEESDTLLYRKAGLLLQEVVLPNEAAETAECEYKSIPLFPEAPPPQGAITVVRII